MRRDWADNLYPGAGNADGRKALEEHLVALLDLEAGNEPLFTLHGPLVEEAQKTLARLSVAQRAYELLKSQARSAALPDWVAARNGGPDFALVFERGRQQDLESVRVPGFFTYAGFQRGFIDQLGDIAEQVKNEQWVLGPGRRADRRAAQYDALGPALLEIYTRDFIAAWRDALGKLRMRLLTADKPKYLALGAAAAATSPIKQLLEIDPRRDRADARAARHQTARRAAGRRPARLAPHPLRRPCCASRTARPAPRSRPRSRPSMCWSTATQRGARSMRSSQTSTRSIRA